MLTDRYTLDMEPCDLSTTRLTLRCPTSADIDRVTGICGDPEIAAFTTVPDPYRRDDARQFIEDVIPDSWSTGTMLTWGIYRRADPDILGVISLSEVCDGSADLGYWIDRRVRGHGFMTEAVERIVDYGFAAAPTGLGLARIGWEAFAGNIASARVAEKVGFALEGVRRQAVLRGDRRHDLTVAGLLREDAREPRHWSSAGVQTDSSLPPGSRN